MEPNINAYGIRLEVLKMAHNDCFELFQRKLEAIKESKPISCAIIKSGIRDAVSEEEITSIYPTTTQIMDRAKSLYKFICEKA